MIFVGNTNPIGGYLHADLTEAQLQAQLGTGWILADGRSVTGSAYATITGNTNVPDCRAMYLKGKNGSRADAEADEDGNPALGAFQSSQVQGHNHAWLFDRFIGGQPSKTWNVNNGEIGIPAYNAAGGAYPLLDVTAGAGKYYTSGVVNGAITGTNTGDAYIGESNKKHTRGPSIIANIFIRIN